MGRISRHQPPPIADWTPHQKAIRDVLHRYNAWVHQTYFPSKPSWSVVHPGIGLIRPSPALHQHRAWKIGTQVVALCQQRGWDPDRYLQALFEKYSRLSKFGGKPRPFARQRFPMAFLPNRFSQKLYEEWEADQRVIAPAEPIRHRLARQRGPGGDGPMRDRVLQEIGMGLEGVWGAYQQYQGQWNGLGVAAVFARLSEFTQWPLGLRACLREEEWADDGDADAVRQRIEAIRRYCGWRTVRRLIQIWAQQHRVAWRDLPWRVEVRE